MTDEKDKPGSEVVLGKKFAGEKFATVKSADDEAAKQEEAAQFDVEGAVPIETYFMNKRITDPVWISMMRSYTHVRRATMAAFDKIFEKF